MAKSQNSTVELAARAIVELINSKPFSPRQSEIAAIIEDMIKLAPVP